MYRLDRPGDDPFQGDLYALPPENYYLPPLDFDEAEQPNNTPMVHNPGFDYIPPDLVSLLITN